MMTLENVTKKFGEIVALSQVSFKVERGELAFLTGPSGAGKTTVIRLLLRELQSDKGRILIEGKDIAQLRQKDLPFYRRKIGVVFQDFKLLADRTVFENVAMALSVLGESPQKEKNKIDKAIEAVGLGNRAGLFPRQLAGGELQRAVLARALVVEPKIILADEPTGNLDPATGSQIVKLLEAAAKGGATVLMATHNAEIVNSFKKQVIKLSEGKVVSDKKNGHYD